MLVTEMNYDVHCYLIHSPLLFFLLSFFMKIGAKSTTIMGLSGTGDIMLTCFVNLSRNKTVGIRLGSGEKLDDILGSMNQVLENLLCLPIKFLRIDEVT